MNEYFLLRVVENKPEVKITKLDDFIDSLNEQETKYRIYEISEHGAKRFIEEAAKHQMEERAKELVASIKIQDLGYGRGVIVRF